MNTMTQRTPKSGRQSLFFQDIGTPVSSRRSGGKFSTPGQVAAVSALWHENFSNSDLPPPPSFTLEDRSDFSPESGFSDYPISVSPELKSDMWTPIRSTHREFSTPKSKAEPELSQQSPSWWSPAKSGGGGGKSNDGKGSPVEGVVHPGALIVLPPPREVARPEIKKNVEPLGSLDEEEWVTVYGFSPADTNLALREFEKCGVILKHVPGPREANWMHILYQNRCDAQKALGKNGMLLNGVLILGVKLVDPMQRLSLNERVNKQGFIPLPPQPYKIVEESNGLGGSNSSYYLQNGNGSAQKVDGTVARPAKSVVSKFMDLMFSV